MWLVTNPLCLVFFKTDGDNWLHKSWILAILYLNFLNINKYDNLLHILCNWLDLWKCDFWWTILIPTHCKPSLKFYNLLHIIKEISYEIFKIRYINFSNYSFIKLLQTNQLFLSVQTSKILKLLYINFHIIVNV